MTTVRPYHVGPRSTIRWSASTLAMVSSSLILFSCVSTLASPQPLTMIHPQQHPQSTEPAQCGVSSSEILLSQDTPPRIKTQTPVIGILTQVLRDYKRFVPDRHLHIAASYVKWIEMAGAQVLPILLNQDDAYYERVFNHTNGLLLPGGDNLLDPAKRTPMMVAARKLYDLAVSANDKGDYYPIWGTCLGMELLSVLTANRNVLEFCKSEDMALTMEFVDRGKLFSPSNYSNLDQLGHDYSKVIVDILKTRNLTYNYHKMCLTDQDLAKAGLESFYRPLAYSFDRNNFKFIAIFESIKYPFYGVQFHPEKAPFEFVIKKSQRQIPHSREAIAVSRYFADFFVTQAQLNGHLIDRKLLEPELIYAHNPMFTAPKNDMYEQRYLFPYANGSGSDVTGPAQLNVTRNSLYQQDFSQLSTSVAISHEEFVDRVLSSDEEVLEEVSPAGRLNVRRSN